MSEKDAIHVDLRRPAGREQSTCRMLNKAFDHLPDLEEVLGEDFSSSQARSFEKWLQAAESVQRTGKYDGRSL